MSVRELTFSVYRGAQLIEGKKIAKPIIRIGRAKVADLVIEEGSRLHAVIEVTADSMTLIDLGSDPRTQVNGKQVNKCELALGDRISVGVTDIVLEPAVPGEIDLPVLENVPVVATSPPTHVYTVAAIVLHVDGVRREEWSDEVEMSQELFDKYPKGIAPSPTNAYAQHKVIEDGAPTNVHDCMQCVLDPGKERCVACAGTGRIETDGGVCSACGGTGSTQCGVCDGTLRAVSCTVRYITDVPIRVRRKFIPPVHPDVSSVDREIDAEASWPSALRFEPRPGFTATAYRGASSVATQGDFQGYHFGSALSDALAAIDEATTGLVAGGVLTYAVPILWLVWQDRHEAFVLRANGRIEQAGLRSDVA